MTERTPNPRYSLTQAAKIARISPSRLGDMIAAGDVPGASKQGKRYYIFAAHFDRWCGLADPVPVVQTISEPIPFMRRRAS